MLTLVEDRYRTNDDGKFYRLVKTGAEAVERKKGIVQPANNHQGGGVEVIFTEGTTKDTVTQPPAKLPDT